MIPLGVSVFSICDTGYEVRVACVYAHASCIRGSRAEQSVQPDGAHSPGERSFRGADVACPFIAIPKSMDSRRSQRFLAGHSNLSAL